ncbi:MAG: hypothetical protein U0163_00315 [Gemmatimonadaceae bacterium]
MPLIPKPHVPEKETIALRIECALNVQLRDYATFAECTKEYVVDAALRRLFKHDKEFGAWCEARHTARPQSARSGAVADAEEPTGEDAASNAAHVGVGRASRKERA